MNWWVENTKSFVQLACTYLEHFLNLASAITGCISLSAFSSLVGMPIVCRTINAEL